MAEDHTTARAVRLDDADWEFLSQFGQTIGTDRAGVLRRLVHLLRRDTTTVHQDQPWRLGNRITEVEDPIGDRRQANLRPRMRTQAPPVHVGGCNDLCSGDNHWLKGDGR